MRGLRSVNYRVSIKSKSSTSTRLLHGLFQYLFLGQRASSVSIASVRPSSSPWTLFPGRCFPSARTSCLPAFNEKTSSFPEVVHSQIWVFHLLDQFQSFACVTLSPRSLTGQAEATGVNNHPVVLVRERVKAKFATSKVHWSVY